jgi:sulfoxide reductase heme-binding subunit YedZ
MRFLQWLPEQRVRCALVGLFALCAVVAFARAPVQSAQAARADGDFQVTLGGTQRVTNSATGATGVTTRRVAYALRTSDGYPRIAINVSQAREMLLPDGQTKTVTGPNGGQIQASGTLTGDGTANDPIGGTLLFNLRLVGVVLPDHSVALRFTSPAGDAASHMTLTVTFASSEDGPVASMASGSLVLAPGTSGDIVAHVWGGATPSAPSANDADPTLWYVTRGAAITAYVLLAAVVALGIALGFRGFEGLVRGWRILDLHQVLTLAVLAFVGLHLITLVLDPFKPFSVLQLLWPLGETYRPVWTALGVLALYLLLAITASSYLRRELGQRLWFALHLTSYAAFVLLTLHGFFAGADSDTPWMLGIYAGASALVLLLTLGRVYVALTSRSSTPAAPTPEPRGPVGAPR